MWKLAAKIRSDVPWHKVTLCCLLMTVTKWQKYNISLSLSFPLLFLCSLHLLSRCLVKWLEIRSVCPMCNKPICRLHPNPQQGADSLQNPMQVWQKRHGVGKRKIEESLVIWNLLSFDQEQSKKNKHMISWSPFQYQLTSLQTLLCRPTRTFHTKMSLKSENI